jgi:DNA-binding NtrC family response regulator
MARILVIDDDDQLRPLLERMLQSAGHEVLVAANGRIGVEIQRSNAPDLVITDIYMPTQEGLETIIELRHHSPSIAIIAMSGKPAAPTMLAIAKRLGAIGFLQKPFSLEQLLQAVEKAL